MLLVDWLVHQVHRTLVDGQEEVFSRTEVTTGAVEHGVAAGDPKA